MLRFNDRNDPPNYPDASTQGDDGLTPIAELFRKFVDIKRRLFEEANLDPESFDRISTMTTLDLMVAALLMLCLGVALLLAGQVLNAAGGTVQDIRRSFSPARKREDLLVTEIPNRTVILRWFTGKGLGWLGHRLRISYLQAAADRILRGADRQHGLGSFDRALLGPLTRRTRTGGATGLIFERDQILVRVDSDQWRRIRRADMHDVVLERTHWWLPTLILASATYWYVPSWWSAESAPWISSVCLVLALSFELRRLTLIYGPAGCVLRVRVPVEELGLFIDWIDASPDSPVVIDRVDAMSRGFLWIRFNAAKTPAGKLSSLLRGLFGEGDLRRFVGTHYPDLSDDIPERGSLLEVIDRLVPALHRAGLVDTRLFTLLLATFPHEGKNIQQCAAAWGSDGDLSTEKQTAAHEPGSPRIKTDSPARPPPTSARSPAAAGPDGPSSPGGA